VLFVSAAQKGRALTATYRLVLTLRGNYRRFYRERNSLTARAAFHSCAAYTATAEDTQVIRRNGFPRVALASFAVSRRLFATLFDVVSFRSVSRDDESRGRPRALKGNSPSPVEVVQSPISPIDPTLLSNSDGTKVSAVRARAFRYANRLSGRMLPAGGRPASSAT